MTERNFKEFATQIAKQFAWLSQHELFTTAVSGEDLWTLYLAAFPPGTNPIYRVRTEHDGSYDRNFIRRFGGLVAIVNGKVETLWNRDGISAPYDEVCLALHTMVAASTPTGIFRSWEKTLGYVSTVEKLDSGATHRWYHFNAEVQPRHLVPRGQADTQVGQFNTNLGVFRRGIEEITASHLDAVIDLIDANTLYRGTEWRERLVAFRGCRLAYETLKNDLQRTQWLHAQMGTLSPGVTLLRSTVMGTLLTDLAEGKDLEHAVKGFELKVAPANYKRPTALITQRMIDEAARTVEQLNLTDALPRRHATLADVSVNNVLWVNRDAQTKMKDGLAGLVAPTAPQGKGAAKNAVDVSIDEFLEKLLPETHGIEVLFSNPLQSNLASLTTAVHADAPRLFKWDNPFAWSYNGNITDSIKEKVKAAGGNIAADLRVSLAWHNYDDLDLHCLTPGGRHIYFGNKMGILDVDMNAGGGHSREPVENMAFMRPAAGVYTFKVHNFCRRESDNVGFTLEVEHNGTTQQFSYKNAVPHGNTIEVLKLRLSHDELLVVPHKDLVGGGIASEKWGLTTEQFVKVNTLLTSPNHWDDDAIGNKHWFFILEGCRNDEPVRGIYNEFLRTDLEPHRKVFEVLGNKTKCEPINEQLSGLGFSSTKRDVVTVRLTHKRGTLLYNIHF